MGRSLSSDAESDDKHPLAELRCPKGCDPSFVQYLEWARGNGQIGTGGLRICESIVTGKYVVWNLGLRCGDCGTHYGRKRVKNKAKQALDKLHDENAHAIQDLVDQADEEYLQGFLAEGRP